MTTKIYNTLYLTCLLLALQSCTVADTPNKWSAPFPVIGSHSSPRAVDLTGDGIKDIIVGAGRNEFQASDIGVIALDGNTGDTLWTHPSSDQIYGSAALTDINQDGTPDAIMVGRFRQLFALDGKTGAQLWKYKLASDELDARGYARFNFYNPVLTEDFTEDGVQEFLVVNGGNVNAAPGDSLSRYPGVLMLMNGADGSIIALDTMPDGRETYLTPTYHDFDGDGKKEIIFGTGGETITGNLYCTDIEALRSEDISQAKKILSLDNQHGYIAPPVIVDLNKDGIKDVLVLDHGGVATALSGEDFSKIWEIKFENTELNAQPTVGYYNEDDVLDVFINGALGKWPKNTGSRQIFLDGKTGQIIKEYEEGCAGFASAVSLDTDGNGKEEVILPINKYNCRRNDAFYGTTWLHTFTPDTSYQLLQTLSPGKNISCTPWIGDLDGDATTDLVYIANANVRLIHEFLGMHVKRIEFISKLPETPSWTEYLGKNADNIYPTQSAK